MDTKQSDYNPRHVPVLYTEVIIGPYTVVIREVGPLWIWAMAYFKEEK